MSVVPHTTDRSAAVPSVPWSVYVVAVLLLAWAAVRVIALFSLTFDSRISQEIFRVAIDVTIGVGLLLRRQWAWVLGVVVSAVAIGVGLLWAIFGNGEYKVLAALIDDLLPGIILLVPLLTTKARRAFAKRPDVGVGSTGP